MAVALLDAYLGLTLPPADLDRITTHWHRHSPPDNVKDRVLQVRQAPYAWRSLLRPDEPDNDLGPDSPRPRAHDSHNRSQSANLHHRSHPIAWQTAVCSRMDGSGDHRYLVAITPPASGPDNEAPIDVPSARDSGVCGVVRVCCGNRLVSRDCAWPCASPILWRG